ncbi:dihydroorotate dehydrogenase electron transfer subunit [Clostridia bacterium]|nr:dihydroorotate dehydrogenase electron transfer subunit [Clostridia bacterium]
MPYAIQGKVISNVSLNHQVYRMEIECPDIANEAYPGQFIQIGSSNEASPLLNRPISIARIIPGGLQIMYAVVGPGTLQLSRKQEEDKLKIIGPLGHGFSWTAEMKKVLLVGGGIGVAPLHALAEALYEEQVEIHTILGFNSQKDVFSQEQLAKWSKKLWVTTMDGTCGIKGHACTPLEGLVSISEYDHVYACGPKPMLKALAKICNTRHIPCSLSMEEYMACGIGVCLGCVTRILNQNQEETYERVCVEGPVFSSREVVFDD